MADGNNKQSSQRRRFLSVAVGSVLLSLGVGAQAVLAGRRKPAVSCEEIAEFTRQFAVLLDSSGLSLVDILDSLAAKQNNPAFCVILQQISARIAEGATLSREMAKYPAVFSVSYIAAIRQGENEGELETAVERLARD